MERAICPCDKLGHIVIAYSLDHFRGWGRCKEGPMLNTQNLFIQTSAQEGVSERELDCLDLS